MAWVAAAPYIASAAASVLGGIMGNKASAKQAEANRDWQERMSNTAHEREVQDLRNAGLNPILSATKGLGGASTPSGSTAPQNDVISPAIHSATNAVAKIYETENAKATNDAITQGTATAKELEKKYEAEKLSTIAGTTNHPLQGELLKAQAAEAAARTKNAPLTGAETVAHTEKMRAETANQPAVGANLRSQTQLNSALATTQAYDQALKSVQTDLAAKNIDLTSTEIKRLVQVIKTSKPDELKANLNAAGFREGKFDTSTLVETLRKHLGLDLSIIIPK